MKLAESYLELYSICDSFNDLVAEEKEVERKFNELDSFLRRHQSDIEKYGLILEISKLFHNNEFNISLIERLIQQKREEEEKRRKRNIALIKWGIILLLIIILTLYKWWATVILGLVVGGLLFQFLRLREKTATMIAKDWNNIIGK